MLELLLGLILLVILLVCGVPVAMCFGAMALFFVTVFGVSSAMLVPTAFSQIKSVVLLSIPFFILIGNLMSSGGLASRLISFVNSIAGYMRGGLGAVAIIGCALFGSIAGSCSAALAAIGPSRTPISLAYRAEDPAGRPDAEKLQKALSAKGLSVSLTPLSGAHGEGILEKADWDLLIDFRRPEIPGPEMWLGGFLDSRGSIRANPAGFSDPDADRLIGEMGTSDRAERERVVRRLAILALDKRPYVMLYQKPLGLYLDKRLGRLSPHPMWPEAWPVDMTSLDPFKPAAKEDPPPAPAGPLIPGFDHPVAEPWE